LSADIYQNGIFVTGGSALLRGMKERLEAKIKLPVHVDAHALISVSRGLGKVLKDPGKYKSIIFQ
jgi:rod shape-determining protein MreB